MAYDKVVDSTQLNATLQVIADSIRKKTGKSAVMAVSQFAEEIDSIQVGGGSSSQPNVLPFTSIERKTWIPATDTMYYQVENYQNLGMIVMFCKGSAVGKNGIHSLMCVTDPTYKLDIYNTYPVGAWSGMSFNNLGGLATYGYPEAGQIGDDQGSVQFKTGEEYTVFLFYM